MIKKIKPSELGFGSFATKNSQRVMNADGSANVKRIGGPLISASDIFHKLTTMKTSRFMLVVICVYTIANSLFAIVYYSIGVENLGITPTGIVWRDLLEAFFFSTQAFTTIGFGRVNPNGIATNIVASLEGLLGLLSFAIATGLIYGRFSRPRAHLLHSKNILVAPYQRTKRAIMFRIASTRKHSILIENTVNVSMGINTLEHGEIRRKFYALELELSRINFMNTSWTIVHPITEESPLWELEHEDLINGRIEFIVLFKAMEETTSQTVIDRFSYFIDELVWSAKFISAIGSSNEGQAVLDLNKIDDFEATQLPPWRENSHATETEKDKTSASKS
jgi:inward rectifier potassium channel